jgi:hypothetical protein
MTKSAKTVKLATLKPNPRNPRTITGEAFQRLCDSIKRDPQFMALRPIITDESGVILGGNQRYRACKHLGMETVPAEWVRVATGLTPEQRKRFVVLDNAPEGISGSFDWDMLAADWDLPELKEMGFDKLMAEIEADQASAPGEAEDHAQQWPECRITFPPRVWLTQKTDIIAALQGVVASFGGSATWPD